MVENSNIEWTTHTFNPWIGCQKVGPGCDHCYAETWDARGLQQRESRWGAHAARTRTAPANWRKPLAWNKAAKKSGKRARVFCASLADVFDNHTSIPPEWREDLWDLIYNTPYLDWMLLTKRPGNIAGMMPQEAGRWSNIWLGCTITSRAEMLRDAPKLKSVDARVRFWSVEPLLGDIGEIPRDLLPDLVIVGGESGPRARPMHPDWARSLRDQCVAAGVPFFFKQWGEWADHTDAHTCEGSEDRIFLASGEVLGVGVRKYGIGAVEPDWRERGAAWVTRVGKARSGRLLDGRTWDQMPGGDHA